MRSVVIACLVVGLAGCSASTGGITIDHEKAEGVARKVADSGTIRLKSVSCPSGIDAKKGADFDCDLVYEDGTKGTITIHQTDDKGSVRTSGTDVHVQGQ